MKKPIHATQRSTDTSATRSDTLLGRLLASGALAGAAALALAPPVDARQDDDEMEYEADEGYHDEEWYDPSDWFNEDDAISYEGDAASTVMYDPYLYPVDYTGYWDGYYDGYYDTSFGYDDWDATWSTSYRTTYTDGYFDGYYDRLNAYDYDPYWYTVSVWDPAEDGEDAKRRNADEDRSRGDRAAPSDGDESKRAETERAEAENRAKSMHRVRGEIASIEAAEKGAKDGHAVMAVAFEDRDAVIADFGPEMSRSDMPIESGDRATLVGRRTERSDSEILEVHKVIAGDETYRLRGPRGAMDGESSADASEGGSSAKPSDGSASSDE